MIKFDPINLPYMFPGISATTAKVDVSRLASLDRTQALAVVLFDGSGETVQVNKSALPKAAITLEQVTAFLQAPAGQLATDSFDQRNERAALPILFTNYGITATVV